MNIKFLTFQASSKRLGRFTLKDDSDSEDKKRTSSGSLFFKKLVKKPSPPPMSTAAEVRAASTATSSSDDRKGSSTNSMQEMRHPVKDRQPVAKDGQSTSLDRHPVAGDKVEKVVRKPSPKSEEKQVQRRASEVCYFSISLICSCVCVLVTQSHTSGYTPFLYQ